MTQEEAIKILQNIYFEAPEVTEALQIAIGAISRSYLPSNLDEAATKYADTQNKNFLKPEIVKNIFKAGAEWMAGQGVTEVSRLYRDPNPPHEGLFFGVLPFFSTIQMALNFQEGEEVIVQIRKKQ